jgi:ATP-dependent DNA helicase RecG
MPCRLDEEDSQKLKKLGISNCLDLALSIPHSYEDRQLYTQAHFGEYQCLDVEIKAFNPSLKVNRVRFFCFNLNAPVEGVLFQPKPYQKRQFLPGTRLFVYGKLEYQYNTIQIIQPRIVKEVGGWIPRYKTPVRTDVLAKLMTKYLSDANLQTEGIPSFCIQALLSIHFPKEGIAKQGTKEFDQNLYALKFTELFNYLRRLRGKREYFPAFQSFHASYEQWAQSLPFTLTDDQITAIQAIQTDLSQDRAAKRMIVGDVGAGKTMVILASAYMSKEVGSILMAPTTVLANQLYEEAQKFLPESMKIALVINKSKKEDLSAYDFIIGTHALLFRDIPKVGLVMIDEQHRFGTAQRNKLAKFIDEDEKRPHFLQFSATPIPRTQAMIDASLLDVSLIMQTPYKKDIDTRVIHRQDFSDLIEHIQKEIKQEHQVLIVYPLVEQSEAIAYQSIEEATPYWKKNFEKVFVTHGKDKEKEEVLYRFKDEGDILLATTVVEVGISLSRLSTVVIVGAERLGLSTLHQLRGRVSRMGLKGYCYLYTNVNSSKRLEEFASTLSGFDIARLDLKYRKSGDLLSGSEQSGESFRFVDMAEDEKIIAEAQRYLDNV